MSDKTQLNPDSLTATVATALSHGDSVLMGETHDTTPKNLQLLDTPDRLKTWAAAGMKHIVLEMDTSNAAALNNMVATHVPADEIAQRLHKQMDYPLSITKAYSHLALDAHEVGVRIEGGDRMQATIDSAVSKLPDQDRDVFSQASHKAPSNRTPHEQAIVSQVAATAVQERGTLSNQQITDQLTKDLHGEQFVGTYGALHMLNENGLNEMLSKSTGHKVTTIEIDASEFGRQVIAASSPRREAINVPDFRYDPKEDKAHALPSGHTTDPTCFRVEDWEKICHHATT